MKLSEICIQRPVFATVLSLILIAIGVMGYFQLPVRFQPKVFRPHLTVNTQLPGASAQEVEQSLTDPLEKALSSTPNLDKMTSQSREGVSSIDLDFKSITQEQFVVAQSQVLQEVSGVDLPEQAHKPQVVSRGGGSQVLFVALTDPNMSMVALANYVNNIVVNRVKKVPGTSDVGMTALPSAVRIDLNPKKMAQYKLTVEQVEQKINDNNQSFAAGEIISKDQRLTINGNFKLSDVAQFADIVITQEQGHFIRLRDIANVYVGAEQLSGWFSTFDGKPCVGLYVRVTNDANPITVGTQVLHVLKTMSRTFPSGMHYYTVLDLSHPLQQSIEEVVATIVEAIVLVMLITFLFLGTLRTTLIPVVTIPVCLISAFSVMYLFGFSINVMTLLALVLAVGLVVDDAIVVMENHHRHMEAGMLPMPAAKRSAKEIGFAIIGMTLSLVAVYLPAGFLSQDTSGVFYHEFAYTLAAAVAFSGFVALTLSPMMCGWVLKAHNPSRYEQWLNKAFSKLRYYYTNALKWSLGHRLWIGVIFLIGIGCGVTVFMRLPSSFLPPNDIDIAAIFLQGPNGASANYTQKYTNKTLADLASLPGVLNYMSFAGGTFNSASSVITFFKMKPQDERAISNDMFLEKARAAISQNLNFKGGGQFIDINSRHQNFNEGDVSFYLAGSEDYTRLQKLADDLVNELKKIPQVTDVNNEFDNVELQYNIELNRSMLQVLQVPINQVTLALQTFFGGNSLKNEYSYGGQDYRVIMRLPLKSLADFKVLNDIYVSSSNGNLVPLSRLVKVTSELGLPERDHYNQLRAGEISFNLKPGLSLGQAMAAVNQIADTVLPPGVEIGFLGNARQFQQENFTLLLIFATGILFIYLVLAALFESFRDPLIILLTVPLCIVGALIALYAIDGTLNMYTAIGLVTLIGLVSKHGVLITQFTNQLRAEGKSMSEALVEAAGIRLRPILMTTLTMILGALPLLFATGAGSVGRLQIGTVVVSGLIVGTLFSLFVVPVAYSVIAKKRLS